MAYPEPRKLVFTVHPDSIGTPKATVYYAGVLSPELQPGPCKGGFRFVLSNVPRHIDPESFDFTRMLDLHVEYRARSHAFERDMTREEGIDFYDAMLSGMCHVVRRPHHVEGEPARRALKTHATYWRVGDDAGFPRIFGFDIRKRVEIATAALGNPEMTSEILGHAIRAMLEDAKNPKDIPAFVTQGAVFCQMAAQHIDLSKEDRAMITGLMGVKTETVVEGQLHTSLIHGLCMNGSLTPDEGEELLAKSLENKGRGGVVSCLCGEAFNASLSSKTLGMVANHPDVGGSSRIKARETLSRRGYKIRDGLSYANSVVSIKPDPAKQELRFQKWEKRTEAAEFSAASDAPDGEKNNSQKIR